MRFKITMSVTGRGRYFPVDYQSYLSSWIYKRIAGGDREFANFLHEQGYRMGHRKFKLFNFSLIDLRPYLLHKYRGVFELQGSFVSFEFGCALPGIAAPLIKGIFRDATAGLGDKINRVDFVVSHIELLPEPGFCEVMDYRVQSLCLVTRAPQGEERHGQYLFPGDETYTHRLEENLMNKYQTVGRALAVAGANEDLPSITVEVGQDYREKKIRLKPFTPQQTDIKGGSEFECRINAPVEVQKVVWGVGLGEKGSMGCGWVDIRS